MAIRPILTFPHPVLRETCRDADPADPVIQRLAKDLVETMYAAPGIGLAAPQVGEPVRLVVVDPNGPEGPRLPLVMLNPEILHKEGEISFEEGCLSVPELNVPVERARLVRVRYHDLAGKTVELAAEDLPAVAIQHEMDHLEGRLILDYASPLHRDQYRKKARKKTASIE